MSKFKEGDRVLIEAVVVVPDEDGDGDIRLNSRDDRCEIYVEPKFCTLIDPGELKVGDPVSIPSGGSTTVCGVSHPAVYHLSRPDGSPGARPFHRDELTKLPPKPTYRWVYRDDLMGVEGHGGLARSIRMDCGPEEVEKWIVQWAGEFNLDADEARKLIAVPTVIATRTIGPSIACVAIRLATGWFVRIGEIQMGGNWTAEESRAIVSAEEAEMLFPKVAGPCLTKVPDA